MANHPSAQKRNRQRVKCTRRNRAVRSLVRKIVRQARAAIAAGSADAPVLVRKAQSALDRAASRNVLPSRRASRLGSRLAIQLGAQGE
jgi:small subunit ribosomal protein S20